MRQNSVKSKIVHLLYGRGLKCLTDEFRKNCIYSSAHSGFQMNVACVFSDLNLPFLKFRYSEKATKSLKKSHTFFNVFTRFEEKKSGLTWYSKRSPLLTMNLLIEYSSTSELITNYNRFYFNNKIKSKFKEYILNFPTFFNDIGMR